jgi:hypothetical protein
LKIVRARVTSGCLSLMLILVIAIAGCGGGDGGATPVKDGPPTGPFFLGDWNFVYDWPGHHRTEGTLEFLPPTVAYGLGSAGRFSYSGTRTFPSGSQMPRSGSGPWDFDGYNLYVTDTIEGVKWEVSSGHWETPLPPSSTLDLTSPYGTLTLTR